MKVPICFNNTLLIRSSVNDVLFARERRQLCQILVYQFSVFLQNSQLRVTTTPKTRFSNLNFTSLQRTLYSELHPRSLGSGCCSDWTFAIDDEWWTSRRLMGKNTFQKTITTYTIYLLLVVFLFESLTWVNFAEPSSESRVPRNAFSETLDCTTWSFAPKTNKLLMKYSLVQTRQWYAEK